MNDAKDPYQNPKDQLGCKKPPQYVVPSTALLHLGMAMRNGALKYGAYNWREKKVVASIYLDAMWRHWVAWGSGEINAPDSGVHHLGHLMACAAILIDAEATGNLVDDRSKSDAVLRLLKDLTEQIEHELHKRVQERDSEQQQKEVDRSRTSGSGGKVSIV